MNSKLVPVLAILLLFLALACQRSEEDVTQLVDQRVVDALAALPTITPQPAFDAEATENLEATIEALTERLEAAESALVTQDKKFQDLVSALDYTAPEDVLTGPLPGSVVITAERSVEVGGCWIHRLAGDGTGNDFLVEWVVDGNTSGLCFNPISACAREVSIGASLPRSCVL
ncbi:MAG: hypothetical protein O2913_13485 [Chloroflexi bacterium]|nr:hypothetical protein [Chloroflexota bacterium]